MSTDEDGGYGNNNTNKGNASIEQHNVSNAHKKNLEVLATSDKVTNFFRKKTWHWQNWYFHVTLYCITIHLEQWFSTFYRWRHPNGKLEKWRHPNGKLEKWGHPTLIILRFQL